MTYQEFQTGFEKLVQAFNVPTPEKKATVYFQEVKNMNAAIFYESCRRLIRQGERFPTIAAILKIEESIRPANSTRQEKADCKECDGFGWAFYDDYAFRGRCEHGGALSKSIPFIPKTTIDEFNWRRAKIRKEAFIPEI